MSDKDPIKLAVLISGSGTTLQNLIDRIAEKRLTDQIMLVVASKADVFGLKRAERAKLPSVVMSRKDFADVESFSDKVFAECEAAGVDLVCLGGWLQLLRIPAGWEGRVLNIHPSLLPKYGGKGMYGKAVHEAVLAAKDKASGCTVHFVNNDFDAGPIILQTRCQVRVGDTPETLADRVFSGECDAYPKAITAYANGDVRLENGDVVWK